MTPKSITYSMPVEMARKIQEFAKAEHRTVNEVVLEAVRQYSALRTFRKLAAQVRKLVKKKGLTEKDFGGPFAE